MASVRYQHLDTDHMDNIRNYNQAPDHPRPSSASPDMDDVELQRLETHDQHTSHLLSPQFVPEGNSPTGPVILQIQPHNLAKPVAQAVAISNGSKRPPIDAFQSPKHSLWISFKKLWANTWLMEIACAIASVISLLAIIAIFLEYNNKQSPQWPHGLTINTIISIFATAMVTFLGPVLGSGLGMLILRFVNG